MIKIKNKKEYKKLRSILRNRMPCPEVAVWQKIRGGALGVKFRRQFSIENYILDFYSPAARLAIEIDGESHFHTKIAKVKDEIRDQNLIRVHGIRVLRFTNNEVMQNLDGVFNKIQDEISTPT
jgi:very-short-patch-repair endonuclease